MTHHCEPNSQMLFKVCSIWTSADIPISDYVVLKNWWRMFALEQKAQLRVWFLVKIKREIIGLQVIFVFSLCFVPCSSTEVNRVPSLTSCEWPGGQLWE